jgi:hypothetical protein
MRPFSAFVVGFLCACGSGSQAPQTPDSGSPSSGAQQYALRVSVAGSGGGSVRSLDSAVDCPASRCTVTAAAGTRYTLQAAAASGSHFSVWTGACSGTGACEVVLMQDQTVAASFDKDGTTTHVLKVDVNGTGKVTSQPTGIDCGSACSASFNEGASVTLTATAPAGWEFAGWSGACSGSGGCTVNLAGDTAVLATFASNPPPPPPDECADLRPAAPGTASQSHSRPVETSTGNDFCMPGWSNGSGTLALLLTTTHRRQLIDFVSPSGKVLATAGGSNLELTEQLSGFIGLNFAGGGTWWLTAWDSAGHETAHRYQGEGGYRGSDIAQDPLGGVVSSAGQSYDDQLNLRWTVAVTASGVGVDRAGRTLFLFDGTSHYGANSIAAQWVDHDGTAGAVFQWFGPRPFDTGFFFEPRVGDGLFIASGGRWAAQIDSLATSTTPAPAWLQARPGTSLHMVRGGRGYAVLPATGADSASCSQAVEVIAPSGMSCGTASFSAGTGSCTTKAITIGYDGTVIQQLPAAREQQCWFGPCTCTWQWWSGFFN